MDESGTACHALRGAALRRIRALAWALLGWGGGAAQGAAREAPDLVVRFERAPAPARAVTLALELDGSAEGLTRFARPSAAVAAVAFDGCEARATDGATLPLELGADGGWQVRHAPRQRIALRYSLRPCDPSPPRAATRNASVVEAGDAQSAVFSALLQAAVPRPLHFDDAQRWDCRLEHHGFEEAGEAVASSLGRRSGASARLHWREFGRSLFLAGALEIATPPVGAGELLVARQRGSWSFGLDELADAAARLLVAERAVFADPGRPTTLLALLSDRGLEPLDDGIAGPVHWNAMLLMAPEKSALRYDNGNPQLLHLLAHEWFHHWLGKELVPLDAAANGHSEAAARWFFEGFTERYANHLLHATGLVGRAAFFRGLNERLAWHFTSSLARRPRAQRVALADHPDAPSYAYFEGELVAWALDAELRAAGHAGGLDAWMRTLRAEVRADPVPLGTAQLLESLRAFAGAAIAARVGAALESGEPLAPPPSCFLPHATLRFESRPLRDPPPGGARDVAVPQLDPQ